MSIKKILWESAETWLKTIISWKVRKARKSLQLNAPRYPQSPLNSVISIMIKLSAIVEEFAFCLDQEKMSERSAACERNHRPECVSLLQRNRYSDARRLILRTLQGTNACQVPVKSISIFWLSVRYAVYSVVANPKHTRAAQNQSSLWSARVIKPFELRH